MTSLYNRWHKHPYHPHIHWSTFLATSLLATLFLLNQINQAYQGYPDVLRVEADTTTGLVAHYTFDEGSGTTAGDSAGNNTGTLTNGPSWTMGKIGGALSFDGVDDAITLPATAPGLSPETGDFTISMWVKWNELPAPNDYLFMDSGGSDSYYLYVSTNNRIGCAYKDGSTIVQVLSSSNDLVSKVGQWRHYVCIRQGTSVTFYDNNISFGSASNVSLVDINTNTSFSPKIGSYVTGSGATPAVIDDIRIYSRALSAGDVSELYAYTGGSSYATPYTTPASSDTTPPIVSNLTTTSLTTTSATITWNTNENANSQVAYGLNTSYGQTTALVSNLSTFHSHSLANLTPNTTYHYRVTSTDGGNNTTTSVDNTFTTSALTTYVTPSTEDPGNTVTATSCSQAHVQAAINNVAPGGTVNIPAGSCTWTTPVSVKNKKLKLIGAGIDVTTITSNQSGVSPLQVTTCSASNFFLGSSISWKLQTAGSSAGIISVGCANSAGYPAVAFRLTQMKMYGDTLDGVSAGGRFIAALGVYGVIDHVTMISLTTRGAGNISMLPDNTISTSNSYHIPINFGDENALYIEDNVFEWGTTYHGNGGVDMYAGSRFVFRRNTVRNTDIGNHGWDSGNRGTRSFEVYQNTFTADSMFPGFEMFGPRSGTGVLWGNTVKNVQPQTNSTGYRTFFTPRYYGATTPYGLFDNVSAASRASGYYPRSPWGQSSYVGTSGPINDGFGNLVTGSNPIDGNQMGPGHMDPQYTRTVNDLVTIAGSKTITSLSANFTASDLPKLVLTSAIKKGRIVTDANWTAGNTTVTSATANFTAGDLGRSIGTPDRSTIPRDTYIASVTNPTTAVLTRPAVSTGKGQLWMTDTRFAKIVNPTTAILDTPAIVSVTGGTLTIGYTDQGYPLADQPGRGSFPTGNAGNWPNVSTGYSSANYQALVPIYLWGNHWQTVDPSMKVLTDTVPPATSPGLRGNEAYIKRYREYYDDPDTGSGTLASLPSTCTTGYGYWVTDRGGNWDTANGTANDGALYKCTSSNTWSLYYTPYVYPHPLVSGAPAPAYTTPYTYPTPNTSYATPVNNVVENPTQTTNTQTTDITGVDPEETKKALIIQIMIQLIALLTELIIKIKSGAAAAISAFSNWKL